MAVFDWHNIRLANHTPQSLMLVKGVGISEGVTVRGETISRKNVIEGMGAMRSLATLGKSKLTIDHLVDTLPDVYKSKFGIQSHTVGYVLDARAVPNTIDGKEIMQGEFIGVITDPATYHLIEQGKTQGCSIEDAARDKICHTKECVYEDSMYINNTISILGGKPNTAHTYIEIMTEDDMKTKSRFITHLEELETKTDDGTDDDKSVADADKKTDDDTTTEKKTTPEKKTEPKLNMNDTQSQKALDEMESRILGRIDERFKQLQTVAHTSKYNEINHEIADVEKELDGFTAYTPAQHGEYLALQTHLEALQEKKRKL